METLEDRVTPAGVPLAYVSGTFAGDAPNQAIVDADFGTTGNQVATFGVNAFSTIDAALAAITSSGQVIVNAGTYAEAVSVTGTQTLTLTAGSVVKVDSLASVLGTSVQITGKSLTLGDATNTTIAGTVTGASDLIKLGTGSVNLTGTDTYTGTTTISVGKLSVNGSITSNVTVTSGGILGGGGTITGNVSGTGTVSPGNSPGILTISGNLTQPGTLALEVDAPYTTAGTNFDQIVVSGTVDLSGTTLNITGGTAAATAQQVVTLIKNNGASSTTINAGTTPVSGGSVTLGSATFHVFYNGGAGHDVVLVDASTPTVTYVESTFAGDILGQVIADADLGTTGSQPAVFGVNAFATIDAALAATTSSGQVIVNAGTYAEAVSVTGTQTLTIASGADVTVHSLSSVTGTTVQISGTSLTLGDATNTTIAGTVTGAGNLIKQGAGAVNLTGTDTYTGTTTISVGKLSVNGSITSNVTVTSGAILGGGGTISGSVSGAGTVSPGNSPGILTIAGNLTQPGTLALEVNAPYNTAGTDFDQIIVSGTVDLTGTALNITGGVTAAAAQQVLTLIKNNGASSTTISGTTNPSQAGTVTLGAQVFKIFYNGGDGNDVVLVDASTPTVAYVSTFAGNNPGQVIADADLGTAGNQVAVFGVNAFTTIGAALAATTSSGQVIVNAGSYGEAVSVTGTQTLTITGGAAITVNSLASVAGTTVQITGSSLTLGDVTNTTIAGTVTGAGNLIKQGAGAVNLTGTDTYTGTTTISVGKLSVNGSITSNVTVTSSGILGGGGTITGNVSGTGTVSPGNSPGILTIAGNLTQPGTLALEVNAPYNTAGTDFDQIIVSGTVDLTGTALNITGGVTAAAAQQVLTLIKNNGASSTTISGTTSPSQAGTVTLGAEVFKIFYNGGDGNDVVLVDASTPTVAYVSSAFLGDNAGQVIADADLGTAGSQPAVFGVNAFATVGAALAATTSSGQVIVNSGTNAGTYAEAVSITGTQTLTITGSAAITFNSLTSIVGTTVQISGTSLTVGDANNTTIAGSISGAGGLIKEGTGTVNLTGTDTYTGTTTISQGKLSVNGSITSNVTVTSPGILGGSGTVTGNVSGTGTVSPGNSPGILTIAGNLTQPGTLALEVNAPYNTAGTDFDQIIVSGTVDLSGTTLNITGGVTPAAAQQVLTLIKHNGALSTTINGSTSPSQAATVTLGAEVFRIFYNGGDGNDVVLVDASTPTVAYVSGTFAGNNPGQVIADADFGTGGNQVAVFGVNAFTTIGAALSAITTSGQVIVNAGTYGETVGVTGTQTLTITGSAAVAVNSLASLTGTVIQNNGTSLTSGDGTSTTVAGIITGSGQLIKQGTGTLNLTGLLNDYSGVTTINDGTFQVDGKLLNGGNVILNASAVTLTGSGTLNRPVVISATGSNSTVSNVTINKVKVTVGGTITDGITINSGANNVTISGVTDTNNKNGIKTIGATSISGLKLTNDIVTGNSLDGVNASGTATLGGTTTITSGTYGNTGLAQNGGDGLNLTGDNVAGTNLILTGAVTAMGNLADGLFASKFPGTLILPGLNISGGTFSSNTNDGIHLSNVTYLSMSSVTANSNTVNGLEASVLGPSNVIDGSHFNLNARGMLLSGGGGTVSVSGNTTFNTNTLTGSGAGIDLASGAGNVTVSSSQVEGNSASVAGGGINVESGYANTLTLIDDTVGGASANQAPTGGGIAFGGSGNLVVASTNITNNKATTGGGLWIGAGTTTIKADLGLQKSTQITGNQATGSGGGIDMVGGTVQFLENLPNVIVNSVSYLNPVAAASVSTNSAQGGSGGGINVAGGNLQMNVTTLAGNSASNSGGGLNASLGTVAITGCTFSGNSAPANGGGGIHVGGSAAVSLINSTVSTNTAGAGVAIDTGASTLTLTQDTIAFNTGGGVLNAGSAAAVTANNSIFASNPTPFSAFFDFSGPITDKGHNLFEKASGTTSTVATDQVSKFAYLAPLENYDGPVQTNALLPGSAALDNGLAIVGTTSPTDARGITRPNAGNPFYDIGAFESRGFVVTSTNPLTAGVNRTLLGQPFFTADGTKPDGTAPKSFSVKVVPNDNLTPMNVALPTKVGTVTYETTLSGAVPSVSTAAQPVDLQYDSVTGAFTGQTTEAANAYASPSAGTTYTLFATVDSNLAAGNFTSWQMYNQYVAFLAYSGTPKNVTSGSTVQFQPLAGNSSTFTATMMDQETVRQPIVVSGQSISIQANNWQGATVLFNPFAVVNFGNSTITIPGFSDGNQVVYHTGGGGAINGLTDGATYFTLGNSPSVRLSLTKGGPPIAFSTAGMSGTLHSLTPTANGVINSWTGDTVGGNVMFNPSPAVVDTVARTIVISGFSDGEEVTYHSGPNMTSQAVSNGNAIGGLVDGGTYYILGVPGNPNKVKLSLTPNGAPISLSLSGTTGSQHSLTPSVASAKTIAGVATFSDFLINQSRAPQGYTLQGVYTNLPTAPVLHPTFTPNLFTVLPFEFLIEGGNFAGLNQKAYNIVVADSSRGTVRFVNIQQGNPATSLLTNQLEIEAKDFVGAQTAPIFATAYTGPVFVSFSVATTVSNPYVPGTISFLPGTPVKLATMNQGVLILSNVTTSNLGGFNVFAQFALTLQNPLPTGSIFDAAGEAAVNTTAQGVGVAFQRSNLGRQRGR